MKMSSRSIRLNQEFAAKLGAIHCAALSIVGASVGVALTAKAFKAAYTPCLVQSVCRDELADCLDPAHGAWSTLLGLPVSLWMTSLFFVTAVLSFRIFRGRKSRGIAQRALSLVTLSSLLLIMALLAQSFVSTGAPCQLCAALGITAMLLVAGARLVEWYSRRTLGRLRLREHLAEILDMGFVLAVVFIVVSGVQSMTFHALRNFFSPQYGCVEVAPPWPQTQIKAGSPEPRVILSLFLDISCERSSREFQKLGATVLEDKFPVPVQLWVYHTPRHACDPTAFSAGYAKENEEALTHDACLAARAVECMEQVRPGTGFALLSGLFALREEGDTGERTFTVDRVVRRAEDLHLFADTTEPGALGSCIQNDPNVRERITSHQLFAAGEEYRVPTLAIHRAVNGAPDTGHGARWVQADTPISAVFRSVMELLNDDPQG